MSSEGNRDLVSDLLSLDDKRRRAALASLRTGLGKAPGEAPRMLPYMAKHLVASDPGAPAVRAAFLVASLYAMHPDHAKGVSVGKALRRGVRSGKLGEDGTAARLVAMIDAHPDDIQHHVEGLMRLCETSKEGIDWYWFHRDIRGLMAEGSSDGERTRLAWARDYWRESREETDDSTQQGEIE